MSETDLLRSWCAVVVGFPPPPGPATLLPRGGEPAKPEAKEKEGREPAATLLSARDLSCSDQLKPWSVRATEDESEGVLGWFALLA